MQAPDKQFSEEQSRQIATLIREELARRRISRQHLADEAKLSISTLEKALGGRRPFTLATTIRLEQALGVSLRKGTDKRGDKGADEITPAPNGEIAPDRLGAYARRAVAWIEGTYVTVRPSFSEVNSIYAYRTDIAWDAAASCLMFHEAERLDAAFTQFGEVAVPNQSGHIHLVTERDGQHRLMTVSRPMITGEMYGIIATLRAGRGAQLTPVAAPIAFLPIRNVATPSFGRLVPGDAGHEAYRVALRRITDEPFALFISP